MVQLYVVVTLALFQQGISPLPRPHNPSVPKQESTNTDKRTPDNKAQIPDSLAPPQTGADSSRQNPKDVTGGNQQQVVRIISVPEVTIARDNAAFILSAILAAVGITGIIIAVCTLNKLGEQTRYLQRQSEIQQTSSRQWVNVSNFQQYRNPSEQDTVLIDYQIVNPTSVPLHLDAVRHTEGPRVTTSGHVTFLPPNTPFPSTIVIPLDADRRKQYEADWLVLNIEISVFFTDAFNNQWTQIFNRIVACRDGRTISERENRTSMERSGVDDEDRQSQNLLARLDSFLDRFQPN